MKAKEEGRTLWGFDACAASSMIKRGREWRKARYASHDRNTLAVCQTNDLYSQKNSSFLSQVFKKQTNQRWEPGTGRGAICCMLLLSNPVIYSCIYPSFGWWEKSKRVNAKVHQGVLCGLTLTNSAKYTKDDKTIHQKEDNPGFSTRKIIFLIWLLWKDQCSTTW